MKEFLARQFWRPRLLCIHAIAKDGIGGQHLPHHKSSEYVCLTCKEGNGIQRIKGIELWAMTLYGSGGPGLRMGAVPGGFI